MSRCKSCNSVFVPKAITEVEVLEDMCAKCILLSEDDHPDSIFIEEFLKDKKVEVYSE